MPFLGDEDYNDLCMRMGFALAVWQHVEEAHFQLYLHLLRYPSVDVASVAYFAVESFAARKNTVNWMVHYFLKDSKLDNDTKINKEWNDINKELKDLNENRNKIAHYSIEFDSDLTEHPYGSATVWFSDARLQPSRHNKVSEIVGRTPDREAHNISADALDSYIRAFGDLTRRIQNFTNVLRSKLPATAGLPAQTLRALSPPVSPPPP